MGTKKAAPFCALALLESASNQAVAATSIRHEKGVVQVATEPGRGIEIDREALTRFRMQ